MRWSRWMIGTSLAAACALGIPGVSLAAHHTVVTRPRPHPVKHTLLPHIPGANLARVFHGVYAGQTWPTLPGPITIREANGSVVTVSVTDATRVVFTAVGTAGELRQGISAGRLTVSVIALKDQKTWVAEVLTAHLTGATAVHPVPRFVTPSLLTPPSGGAL